MAEDIAQWYSTWLACAVLGLMPRTAQKQKTKTNKKGNISIITRKMKKMNKEENVTLISTIHRKLLLIFWYVNQSFPMQTYSCFFFFNCAREGTHSLVHTKHTLYYCTMQFLNNAIMSSNIFLKIQVFFQVIKYYSKTLLKWINSQSLHEST